MKRLAQYVKMICREMRRRKSQNPADARLDSLDMQFSRLAKMHELSVLEGEFECSPRVPSCHNRY